MIENNVIGPEMLSPSLKMPATVSAHRHISFVEILVLIFFGLHFHFLSYFFRWRFSAWIMYLFIFPFTSNFNPYFYILKLTRENKNIKIIVIFSVSVRLQDDQIFLRYVFKKNYFFFSDGKTSFEPITRKRVDMYNILFSTYPKNQRRHKVMKWNFSCMS